MPRPGFEPGLLRPQRRVLTTIRSRLKDHSLNKRELVDLNNFCGQRDISRPPVIFGYLDVLKLKETFYNLNFKYVLHLIEGLTKVLKLDSNYH